MFAKILSRYWWMTLIRGLLWVLFGIVLFVEPGLSLVTLATVFGALRARRRHRKHRHCHRRPGPA